MWIGTYKKIFNRMPQGVFVFDDKLRVKFTNVAFRRSFSERAQTRGTLAQTLDCTKAQNAPCGSAEACAFCAFYRAMRQAVDTGEEKTETLHTAVTRDGRTDKVSVRIRILPIDKKLFLGLTDGTYETEMQREMLSAKQTQMRLLPAGKSMGGVPYSYMYIPCLGVGGDMPDVYELNGQTYGILADVSGKGVSAGILTAFVKAGFDRKEENLARALSALNAKFNEIQQDERSYVTMSTVRIDKSAQKIRYAVAGHSEPILLKNKIGINEIEFPAPPISNWLPDYQYTENEFPYEKGDLLVLLTDGVTDCENAKGERFGIERTESVLLQSHSAEDFIGKLKTALNVFSGGNFSDDITAIAFDL